MRRWIRAAAFVSASGVDRPQQIKPSELRYESFRPNHVNLNFVGARW